MCSGRGNKSGSAAGAALVRRSRLHEVDTATVRGARYRYSCCRVTAGSVHVQSRHSRLPHSRAPPSASGTSMAASRKKVEESEEGRRGWQRCKGAGRRLPIQPLLQPSSNTQRSEQGANRKRTRTGEPTSSSGARGRTKRTEEERGIKDDGIHPPPSPLPRFPSLSSLFTLSPAPVSCCPLQIFSETGVFLPSVILLSPSPPRPLSSGFSPHRFDFTLHSPPFSSPQSSVGHGEAVTGNDKL